MPARQSGANPTFQAVRVDLIDEPERPIRETMDEAKLEELIDSIREVGLIEPLVLECNGHRYRIEAGHRRYLAVRALDWKTVPAVVWAEGKLKRNAVKLHENIVREDLSAAEEANWFAELLETHAAGDVDVLCELVKKKRGYVEARLLVRAGDPEVFQSLAARKISYSVAKELNAVKDPGMRRVFQDAAEKGGANALQVKIWRQNSETLNTVPAPDPGDGSNQFTGQPNYQVSFECLLCETSERPWEIEMIYVHRGCRAIVLDRFLAQVKGVLHGTEPGGGADARDRRHGVD